MTNNQGDRGLRRSGTVTVRPAPARGFIRRDPANPQSFRYDNGERFFMLGQTAYELVTHVRAAGVAAPGWKAAIAHARAHGMTKLRLLVHPWGGNTGVPDSFPFVANDHDTLALAHWQTLDAIVQELQQQGMAADLILFTDTGDQPSAYGAPAQDERYVRYILARYAAYPHVIWCLTNEWNYTGKGPDYWNRIGTIVCTDDPYAIRDGAERARSIHARTDPAFRFFGQAWPSYAIVQYGVRNKTFAFGDQWGNASIVRNAGQGLPVANDEYGYIGEPGLDRVQHRRALWGIGMGGGFASAGDARTGGDGLPAYRSGAWQDAPEYADLQRYTAFWTTQGIHYWELSSQNAIVTSGTRVYALGKPGGTYVIYAAAGGAVTVSLPPGPPYTVTRFNPRDGTSVNLGVAGGPTTWTLPAPDDWVLVLQEA
jgi:hypothetical protein